MNKEGRLVLVNTTFDIACMEVGMDQWECTIHSRYFYQ